MGLLAKAGLLDLKAASVYTRRTSNWLRHQRNVGNIQPVACELLPNRSWRHLYSVEDLAPLVCSREEPCGYETPPCRSSPSSAT